MTDPRIAEGHGGCFGDDRRHPLTFAGVAVLLLAVSLLATAVPAFRAARVQPTIALRAE